MTDNLFDCLHRHLDRKPPSIGPKHIKRCKINIMCSGAVRESRWLSWVVRPNEPSGFRGCKSILNYASALITACP